MPTYLRAFLALVLLATTLGTSPVKAAEPVTVGVVGSGSGLILLYYIAKEKALFEKEGLAIDLISVSSSSDAIRQLSAGSLNFMIGGGLVDPIRAAALGASVGIARIEGQAPPYVLMGKKGLTSVKDLKGKVVSVGGAFDITKVYVERMLSAAGVNPKDVDFVYAGATTQRYAALQSGAVEAAIVAPPYNFAAETAGFVNLGNVAEVVKDLPFSGDQVDTKWAPTHLDTAKKFLVAYGNAVKWFYDAKNEEECIGILVKYTKASAADAKLSYDFFQKIQYFEKSDKVSKKQLDQILAILTQFGDGKLPTAQQMVLPALTELVD